MGNLLIWEYFASFWNLRVQLILIIIIMMLVILPSQASVYGRSQLRLESATAADSGDYHLLWFQSKIKQPTSLYSNEEKSIQATTPVLSSEAEICWTQSATASESKVNSTHSHCYYDLFLTLEVSTPPCFSKWPACYFPTKPSVNKLHSSAQWSFLTSSSTEAAKYKGSQGDQQFHLTEVSVFIYLQMVIRIIIIIVIVLGLSFNDWNNSQQLCSKLQIFFFICTWCDEY